ncbi:uncharacterized protein [Ptychodera flava]|uniref:uncharacterized protein n=1 Tax=Ptychodera flava TaxID=63121 RepID=UPI003969CC5D
MTPCFHGGACDDGEGTLDTFTCDCSGTGYTGTHCSEDEDECTMGTDNCHASLATCINLPGTFNCSCIAGYTGNGVTCSDVDECSNGDEDCVGLSTCVNTVGSFTCSCNSGYTGDGRTSGTGCSDIDECSLGTDDCDAVKSTCNNTVGAFVCNCKDGYQDDDNDNACEDFDECTAGVDDCEALATCTNTEGSYTCPCNAGYDGDGTTGGTGCSDVDECSLGTDSCLATTSTCVNAVGSYTCTCKTGFNDDDGDNSCEDTNECSAGTDNCHASLGVCTNNFGSFSCSCIVGYSGDGVSSCSDIDECGTGSDSCDASISSCTNSIGSYVCNCDAGYQDDDGDNSCADDDECSKGSDNCHSTLGACTNTVGSFTCACDTGYEGDGVSFCTDIDECTVGHSCHTTYGICTNTAGSYTCACRNGFAGNGFTCAEIDECTGITCSHRGSCIDKVGYYKCECDYGYWGTDCEYSFFYVNTVQMTAGSLYWPFDNVTASNTYMDSQLGTPGQAGNTAPNDYGISGMSVMLQENGTSDCIDFGDFDSDCISDTGLCTEGLSASIWVRFTESQIKESDSKYIVSSGPPDSTGFSIYKENNKFYVVVNNGTYNWEVRVQNQIPADLWTNIGFSWHWQHGLDVTVDANSVGTDPTGTQSMSPDVVDKLTVGCRFNTASLTEHVSGLLDEFAVWPLFTNSTDYVKLMGGLDIDDCVSEPCVYGDCYDVGLAAYQCECNPGYNGTDCEIEIDECASNPCANGGTCSDLIAAFSCECTFGFTGDFCDLDLTPNYDFSQVVDLSPGFLSTTPETNPYYILAPFIWQLNTGGGSLTITGSNFTIVAGRQNVGLYVQIGADDTWVDLGDYPNHCIGLPRECVDGISVSLWLKIDSRVKDTTPAFLMYSGAANQGGRVGLAIMITNANALLLQVVDGYNEVKSASIPESSVPWDQWANVAFNWDVTDGTQAFINGRLVADAVRVTESSGDYNSDNLLTLGTQYNSLNSGFPVAYSDVVIWNRRLNDFEAHRFLGMTRREYTLVTNANYFWSTDSWVRKDHLTVSEYDAFFNNTAGGLNLPGDGAVLLMPGRDEKGNSILILGCCDQWLYMGDFAGECVSNPSLCTEGLSVSLWVQLSEIQDNTTHFLISSGEQVTMGFSIYQRGDYETVSKLGAALTDGNYRWVLEIPYQPYVTEANTTEGYFEFSDWVNLGLTWSDRSGLHLYIDGIQHAADFTGYRKIRPEDFETRLILGRRNDFLDNDSNFTFEEFAVFERELKPYELRELFGLTENLNYKDATYHWDTHGLITSDYFIMANNAPDPSMGFIGPNEYVEIVDDDTIELTGQQSDIILGNFTGACISDPSYCDAGLTVSFWINFAYTTSGTAYLLSSGAQASSRGFAVFRQAAILKFMINDGSEKINALYDINDIPNGEWCNLAFTWHRYLGFTAYLNGNEMSATSIGTLSGSNTDDHTLLLLGRRNDAESQYADFKIHSLVIWHEYTYSRQIHRLLGISEIEKYHYDKADYLWTFETPTSLYFSGTYSSSGISYIADRHSIGKAICTDGSTGYMHFGQITCLSNPSTCNNGFAVAMWIKLRDIPSIQGHLVSVGAQEEDEKGFVVTQKPSLIEVIVGDGSRQWKVEIRQEQFSFKYWEYFAFIWSSSDGLTVSINGTEVASEDTGSRNRDRTNNNYKKFTLGRSNSAGEGYILACYDDVIVIVPDANEQLPTPADLYGDPECTGYPTANELFTSQMETMTWRRFRLDCTGTETRTMMHQWRL